jgi:hypothetical protein
MGGLITSRPIMFIGIQRYDIATIWSPRQGSDLWLHGQGKGGLITSQPYHPAKIPVGNTVSSGHQAKAVSSGQTLK